MPVRIVSDIDKPSGAAGLLGFLGPAVATLGAAAGDAIAAHKAKAAMANPLANMLNNHFQTPAPISTQPTIGTGAGAFSGMQPSVAPVDIGSAFATAPIMPQMMPFNPKFKPIR